MANQMKVRLVEATSNSNSYIRAATTIKIIQKDEEF